MNGQPTGVESADAGRAVDAENPDARAERIFKALWEAEKACYEEHEYKAAREIADAIGRLEAREGERRRQALHGQNPQDAEEVI